MRKNKKIKLIIVYLIVIFVCFSILVLDKIYNKTKTHDNIVNNNEYNTIENNNHTNYPDENNSIDKKEIIDIDILDKYKIDGKLVPTYSNCSYYFYCDKKDNVKISYRDVNSTNWNTAYDPVYDIDNNMYKGSIVGLQEGTEYNIKFEIIESDTIVGRYNMCTTTWNTNISNKKDIYLSKIISDDTIGKLTIQNINGSEKEWINIICDIKIDSSESNKAYVVYFNDKQKSICSIENKDSKNQLDGLLIDNCKYTIIRNSVVAGGIKNGIRVYQSLNVRVNNAEVYNYGRNVYYRDEYGVAYGEDNEPINYDSGIMLEESGRITVEKCYVHSPNFSSNAWDDNYNSISHPKGANAMYIKKSQGNNVIRYNDFVGSDDTRFNDVIEGWNNTSVEGGLYKDSDVYGNLLAYGNDDGIELDGGQINLRVYNNKITGNLTGISLSPNLSGPSYIFRNEISNLSDITDKSNYVIKTSGGEYDYYGYTFIFQNTFIATDYVYANYKEEKRAANVISRNNILITNKNSVIDNTSDVKQNSYDYDLLYSRNNKKIFKYETKHEKNGTIIEPLFINELQGILLQEKNSKGVDGNTKTLNNFNDNYVGSSPDFGAYENGVKYSYLGRPSSLNADSYLVNLSEKPSYNIKVSLSELEEQKIKVCKPNEDLWYDVTLSDNIINKDKVITCKIKLNNNKKGSNHSAVILKLDNGESVSICIEK